MSFARLPIVYAVLLFVVLPSVLTVVVSVAIRRARSVEALIENNDFGAIAYPVIGLIYGVFLAFAVVIVWQQFSDAQSSTYHEVTSLGQLWRDTQAFPADTQHRMHGLIRTYVDAVQGREWPSMARGEADAVTAAAYDNIWRAYYGYTPRGETDRAFFAKSLDELNDVGRYRQERLLYSQSKMPGLMWAFLIFGAVVTIGLSFFLGTKQAWTHACMCASIAALVCFSLVLILSMSRPFSGDVSIDNSIYVGLLRSFQPATLQPPAPSTSGRP